MEVTMNLVKPCIMKIVCAASLGDSQYDGMYVIRVDVDAHDGRGELFVTDDPRKARHFGTYRDAVHYYQRQSQVRKLRPDGKPNRPLTAFTVEITPA